MASLMLIHGLYPVPLEQRVGEALDSVRPYMESHGGDVELLGIEDGVARLRLQRVMQRLRRRRRATLELAIEAALQEHAPDLLGLDVEGVVAPRRSAPDAGARRGVGRARGRGRARRAGGSIGRRTAGSSWRTSPGRCSPTATAARAAARRWPTAMLLGGTLACAHCGRRFDLPRAGRGARRRGRCSSSRCRCCATAGRCASRCRPRRRRRTATCELCPIGIGEDHRHLLHLDERRIICVCETCWSMRSGDPEFRPPGARTLVARRTST